jgi:hypothetical protein
LRLKGVAEHRSRLKALCLKVGADDVGFASVDHPDVADQRSAILALFPAAKALGTVNCEG